MHTNTKTFWLTVTHPTPDLIKIYEGNTGFDLDPFELYKYTAP